MESIIDYVDILDKVLKNENKEQLFLQLLNENKELKEENEEWMKIQRNEYEQIKEISNLKKQNDELKNENKNFKELNEKLENKNKVLENEIKVLEDKYKVLENEYKALDNESYNDILKDRNIDFKELNKKLKELNKKLKELNKKLKEKNINIKKQNEKSNKEKSDKEEDDKEKDNEDKDDKKEYNEDEDDEEVDDNKEDNEEVDDTEDDTEDDAEVDDTEDDAEDDDNKEEDYLKVLKKKINNLERQNEVLGDENDVLENENEVLENENKVLENENKFLENENKILENEILVINDNFLVNFENYLNQIINFYINIPIDKIIFWYDNNGDCISRVIARCNIIHHNEYITLRQQKLLIWHKEFVENYQKILDDYRNKKFYIINSFNIFIKSKDNIDIGFILFINNYGCIYGFNIIRDQWDKIICCNLSIISLRHRENNYISIRAKDHKDIEINKSIFNYTFDYEYKLSPNKIKLISKLPFNETYSHQINVLFLYLNFICTNS
jgi:hypothetical protein